MSLPLERNAIQAHEKVISLGRAEASNYFHLAILYCRAKEPDPAIDAFEKAIQLEPEKYKQILREELKSIHSVLDPVRYKERFTRLLTGPAPKPEKP